MNQYLIITIASMLCCIGAGFGGFRLGVDHEKAGQIDKQQLIAEAVDAATNVSAQAISKIRITNTTIQQEVQGETRTEPVYIDCRHTPDGLRLVNAALTGVRTKPAGRSKLPKADTSIR